MSWQRLLANRKVQRHRTSKSEIDGLREIVVRDLADASLLGLSSDRRYARAYYSILQLSKMAIACAGYRVSVGAGHYQNTFEAVKVALGKPGKKMADYFKTSQRKRNHIDYDYSNVATETEANEMLEKAQEYQTLIEGWIETNHSAYKA